MRKIIFIGLFVFLITASLCYGALNVFTQSIDNRNTVRGPYAWTGHPSRDLCWTWAKEVENRLDGGAGNTLFYFTPGTAPTTAAKGMMYYDSSGNSIKYYTTSWQTLGTTAGVSLDDAYDLGESVTVDSGTAVTLTTAAASDSAALSIVHGETGNYNGLLLTNASAYPGIQITTTGAGADITGTSAKWSIAKTGVGTFLTIALENGEIISNATNDKILFDTGDEDLLLDMTTTANTITLGANSTGATTFAMGDFVTLTGLNNLTGAAGADYAIATANTGTYNLTVSQTGTGDNQVIVQSAGTAANAVELISSVAGITLTSADDVTMAITDDLIIVAADDVSINSNSASGVINLGTNNDGITINIGTDDTAADTINVGSAKDTTTVTGVGVTIASGVTDITLDSGDDIFLTADTGTGDVISLQCVKGTSTSSIVVTSTVGGIDLDSALSTHITSSEATGDAIYLHASDAAGGVDITSGTGDVTITSTDDIVLTNATAVGDMIQLLNTAGTSVSENSAAIQLTATAGGIHIQSDASIDGDTVVLRVDGGATADILLHNDAGTGADCINLLADEGGITLTADGAAAGDILIDAEDDIQLTTTGKLTITNTEAMTVSGAATISGTTTVVGFVQVDQVVTDAAAYDVTAANSGKIHIIGQLAQNTRIDLPAEADGLNYEFWYSSLTIETHDHTITSEDDGNELVGNVVHLDTSDDTILAVYASASDSNLLISNADGGTIIKVTCDGTDWYVTGTVVSDTAPAFSGQ